jgi:phosphoglycerate dehydrogenase-like enzyme
MDTLRRSLAGHNLLLPDDLQQSNLAGGAADPLLARADVAFGQPEPRQVIELSNLRWVHLTTAGYTRYDSPTVRDALSRRGAVLTTSSWVYEEPCAEHALAMMLSLARQLPPMLLEQQSDRAWRQAKHRARSRLLAGQTAVLFGYGTIARRLSELLGPLGMELVGVRRVPKGDEPIRVVPTGESDDLLGQADHVVNVLPAAAGTDLYFDARRFGLMKPGAAFYNIGRGTTVDQTALLPALQSGRLSAAYLDVTDPEPLPPGHPLWSAPNCYITPHTAGGHSEEFERLALHFLNNLKRFEAGQPLADRVIHLVARGGQCFGAEPGERIAADVPAGTRPPAPSVGATARESSTTPATAAAPSPGGAASTKP